MSFKIVFAESTKTLEVSRKDTETFFDYKNTKTGKGLINTIGENPDLIKKYIKVMSPNKSKLKSIV